MWSLSVVCGSTSSGLCRAIYSHVGPGPLVAGFSFSRTISHALHCLRRQNVRVNQLLATHDKMVVKPSSDSKSDISALSTDENIEWVTYSCENLMLNCPYVKVLYLSDYNLWPKFLSFSVWKTKRIWLVDESLQMRQMIVHKSMSLCDDVMPWLLVYKPGWL